jgi:pimeloyl-ACP methyl ester carboxylesterase
MAQLVTRRHSGTAARVLGLLSPDDMDHVSEQGSSTAALEAFRSGAHGVARDLTTLSRGWGFGLASIRADVQLWHGSDDRSAPVAVAEAVAACLPKCEATVVDGAGHELAHTHADPILAGVATSL